MGISIDEIKQKISVGLVYEASELLDKYENSNKDDVEMYSIKSVILVMKNELESAENITEEGLKKYSDNFDLNYNLAYIKELKREYPYALELYYNAFDKCIENDSRETVKESIERIRNIIYKKEEPLVSVLIPVYNRASIVGETIDCVINQSYKNLEIIICDNCSTDDTFEVLRNYQRKDERIKIYRNESNLGPVLNWKRCFEESSGKYIKLLFSDDLIEYSFIDICTAVLESHNDMAFVYTSTKLFNIELGFSEDYYISNSTRIIEKEYYLEKGYASPEFPVSATSALFRRSDFIIEEIDYMMSTGAGSDILIYLNSLKNYNYIYHVNSVIAFFRHHSGSITVSKGSELGIIYLKAYCHYYLSNGLNKYYVDLLLRFFSAEISNTVLPKLKNEYGFDEEMINKIGITINFL